MRDSDEGLAKRSTKSLFESVLPNEDIPLLLKSCRSIQEGEQIKHVFTHRKLWIQIWNVSASELMQFSSHHLKWISLRQLGKYGLPQPIKLALQGLSLARGGELRK